MNDGSLVDLIVLEETVGIQLVIDDGPNDGQTDGDIDLLDGVLVICGNVGFIVGYDDVDDTVGLLV